MPYPTLVSAVCSLSNVCLLSCAVCIQSTEQVLYEAAEEERAVGGGGSAADENSTAGAGGGLKKALTVWDVIAYGNSFSAMHASALSISNTSLMHHVLI